MIHFVLLLAALLAIASASGTAALRIVAPVGGSTLLVDSTVTIRWEGANGAAVDLWYSTDGRQTWQLLASQITDSEYQWTVPDLPSATIVFRAEVLFGADAVPLRVFANELGSEIRDVSFSRDGRYLLSGGGGAWISRRDLVADTTYRRPLSTDGNNYTVQLSATADTIFTNQTTFVFVADHRDPSSSASLMMPEEIRGTIIRTFDVISERNLIVTGGEKLHVWDYKRAKLLGEAPILPSLVYKVAFSHDGNRVVYAGDDGMVYEWNWVQNTPVQVYQQHGAGNINLVVWGVAYAPGDTMLASGGVDGTVRIWNESAGRTGVHALRHKSHVRSVMWAPDARRVVSGSLDSTIRQWDAKNGRQIGAALNHGAQVLSVAYSPTGDTIASAGRDGTVILWKSGFSGEGRDTASYVLGRECVLEIPHLTGNVGKGIYVPLVWRNRADIPEFMTADGVALIELPTTLLETVAGGNTLERRRGTTRDTVLVPVRPGVPGDTIAVIVARVLLGVPVRQDIRILSVEWQPGVRLVPTTVDGSITVQDTCGLLTLRAVDFAGRNTALSIAPNPAVERASATFTIAVDEAPHLAVYDARGVEVAVVEHVPAHAGTHTVELPVERLVTGEYFVRLHTGGRQYSAKFTVVR